MEERKFRAAAGPGPKKPALLRKAVPVATVLVSIRALSGTAFSQSLGRLAFGASGAPSADHPLVESFALAPETCAQQRPDCTPCGSSNASRRLWKDTVAKGRFDRAVDDAVRAARQLIDQGAA